MGNGFGNGANLSLP
uniref:Uncharacterized protein n=1 Tax=Moniliophthora roreri TaxID=221103 RepID=A0A0W0FYR8_MONRR